MELKNDSYDFNSERVINLHDTKSTNLYFKIGDRSTIIDKETFITVSLSVPAQIGNGVDCEWKSYEVIRIEDELIQESRKWKSDPTEGKKGFTFQKLIVRRIS